MTECGWDIEMSADKEGNSALAVACRYSGYNWGNAAIPYLLKSGASVNAVNRFGQTPLMLLYGGRAWDGRSPYKPYDGRVDGNEEAKFLEMLLEAGADTGKRIFGETPCCIISPQAVVIREQKCDGIIGRLWRSECE